ncbi:hypothetical protein NQ028_12660 [Corynebacterium phoceense]|uniref:hypothetical protein n=1 Tax=Corynebacterium phoceense TaxID=1686286 RepID=UPI00211BC36E|nr:hypothetical protein [Corynebacterium phoceense]MCQ9341974.1 hypothetical protein [Corynebacterium phoceense]
MTNKVNPYTHFKNIDRAIDRRTARKELEKEWVGYLDPEKTGYTVAGFLRFSMEAFDRAITAVEDNLIHYEDWAERLRKYLTNQEVRIIFRTPNPCDIFIGYSNEQYLDFCLAMREQIDGILYMYLDIDGEHLRKELIDAVSLECATFYNEVSLEVRIGTYSSNDDFGNIGINEDGTEAVLDDLDDDDYGDGMDS